MAQWFRIGEEIRTASSEYGYIYDIETTNGAAIFYHCWIEGQGEVCLQEAELMEIILAE